VPQEIRAISLNLTSEIGADDAIISIKVVPDGRKGAIVYGRTPNLEEEKLDIPIKYYPENGEELHFKSGSLKFSIIDIDKYASKSLDGYSSISNTLWTWLSIGSPLSMDLFMLILSAGRRLDAAHSLLVDILNKRSNIMGDFISKREYLFGTLSLAEVFIISLNRAVCLIEKIKEINKPVTNIPNEVQHIRTELKEIRDAFEHIDERAFGRIKKESKPEVFSIFNQSDFFPEGIISYLDYKLDLINDIPVVLVKLREYLFKTAVSIGGELKICSQTISFT
jgi:hypothetical protein